MKKFLLLAVAALVAVSADAQLSKKMKSGKLQARQQVEQKATFSKKYEIAGAKKDVKAVLDKTSKMFKGTVKATNIKPVAKQYKSNRAAAVQEVYEGYGMQRSTSETVDWEMKSGTATLESGEEISLLQNVIPDIFGFEDGVVVEYTVQENKIVIAPQLVASFEHEEAPTGTYYIFLEDANSNDGTITLTMDETGGIDGYYSIIYSVYPAETYNYNDWVATYEGFSNVQYNIPGVLKTPNVSFEQNSLILFAGLGLNGYSYTNNLAMTGAFATTNFVNRTTDKVTDWDWTAWDASSEEPAVFASASDVDFALDLQSDVVKNVQLVGTNETKSSDPFIFGVGKYIKDDGTPQYENSYLYGGYYNNGWILNNETPAIMTRQDPDGHLKFYSNWATPDIASTSMSKIYCYHEKPAAPLFFTGVTLPLVSFVDNGDFNLHIKIMKCSHQGTKLTLGEVIAEGNATSENINADFSAGLTGIEIPLYKEDEFGMSIDLDYIFVEDEFVIVIEGWDNGSFSGVLGSQDAPLDNASISTWFEKTGEEGSMYRYTSWPTALFVGLLNASYGYLYTEDNTNITLPSEGGQAVLHINPMLCTSDDNDNPATLLWIDDESDTPDWLSVGLANEAYTETEFSFDLVLEAEALPEGSGNRSAHLVFVQTGAKLVVDVTQNAGSGINTVVTRIDSNAPAYNVAGQRVNNSFKGLVVKDGRKVVVK